MSELVRYGSTNTIPFKITLNGVAVPGLTLQAADLQLSKDGAAFANVGTAVTEIGLGWYLWTPAAGANTECGVGVLNLKDDIGTVFSENGIVFYTGGNVSARFNGV